MSVNAPRFGAVLKTRPTGQGQFSTPFSHNGNKYYATGNDSARIHGLQRKMFAAMDTSHYMQTDTPESKALWGQLKSLFASLARKAT